MTTRTGNIGNCYEYYSNGHRLAGADRMTIAGMVALSKRFPDTYHEYVGTNGYTTWARAGREISNAELPAALR